MTFKYNKNSSVTIFCVLLLMFFDLGHIQTFPSESKPEDMKKLESLRNDRAHLVDQFWDLQGNLSDLVESYGDGFSGEEEDVIVLVKKVKDLSEKMNDLSKDIFQLIGASGNAEERAKEKEQQKQQKDDVAETLFNAKARKCMSSEETYYEPLMKCYKIGESADGPCNKNQWLFEIDGTNQGICDCKIQVGLVYHNQSGGCHQLNTQGPCENGKWLIYDPETGSSNGAICESVPDKECILDGAHVFYKDQCWKLGSKGPCENGQILDRSSESLGVVECSIDPSLVGHSFADKVQKFLCPPGSRRAQNNQCRTIYRPGSGK